MVNLQYWERGNKGQKRHMKIVIIGNSAAGMSALETFRKLDSSSSVTMIAKESYRPYSKVLLPYYLRGKVPYGNLFIRDKNYYDRLDVEFIKKEVVSLLPEQRAVKLADGTHVPYDKLLITTGSSPAKPDIPGLSGEGIHHLWTLEDGRRLNSCFKKGKHVAVLGSGFVSLQGACAALSRGMKVSVIELMSRIMPKALDARGAELLSSHMKQSGVELRVNTSTEKVEHTDDNRILLHFNDGTSIISDFIIVGTGVKPNISFLEDTGIEIDDGILVDRQMETSSPGIFAAGDVAQVPSFAGTKPVVHPLWPTAVETGRIAGSCMAMSKTNYKGSLNMNVTQMFDVTVASMGEFSGAEGNENWVDETLPDDSYLKIVLKDGFPIGATCVGGAELVSTLGLLRPLIREKVRLQGNLGMLKENLAKNISQHHEAFVK
jgi:nitrite reductase (NADH) large subunit